MGGKAMVQWSKQITTSQVAKLIRAERDTVKALLIFDSATAEYANGFRHDHLTFRLMMSKFLSANQFSLAEGLLVRMKEEKSEITEDIFLSICRAYGRVHRPLDVIRVFQKMKEFNCECTIKSYVTVFDILVEENLLNLALKFYRHMRQKGIPPCVASLNVLIKALCKNSGTMDSALKIFHQMPSHGCSPDSYTYGTLINGLCRYGKIHKAKELFEEMEAKGCSPTVVTYTSLIHGMCRSKNMDEALRLLEEMIRKRIEPNVFTYSSLMDGFCKAGNSSQAMDLFEMMIKNRHKPNTITYSTLVHGLCQEGKLQDAVMILDRMKLQGLKPDAGLYGKIISGFCDICKFKEAANFLDEMILGGISPNRITWSLHVSINNKVVLGLCANNDQNRAFQLYRSMRARGISIYVGTFDSLVKCFSEKGDLNKATYFLEEMVVYGCVPDEGTWSSLVCQFWDEDMAKEVAETLRLSL